MDNQSRRVRYAAHLEQERARARSYYESHREERRAKATARARSARAALPAKRCVECGAELLDCHRNRIRCATCPRPHSPTTQSTQPRRTPQ